MPNISYRKSGVDYDKLDPIKIAAQSAAKTTAKNHKLFGYQEMAASRGESAYVWEEKNCYKSLVVEGLGTKNLVADEVSKYSGKSHYGAIAQDAVAMIVNDLIVVGAIPQVVNAYFAVGDSNWLTDKVRAQDLISGWAKACNAIGATWGGGETPTLSGIIEPGTIDIGGAAIGEIKPKKNLVLGNKLTSGDTILLVESSGIHSNGITLARKVASKLKDGYQTKLSNGKSFGESILTPTHLYVQLVKALLKAELDIHYMANITGHGWRKLMRAQAKYSYIIDNLPPVPKIFSFIAEQSGNSETEMYGNYNMGAGYAIYLPKTHALQAQKIAKKLGLKSWIAGRVETGPKKVVITPKNIMFSERSLAVR